VVSDLRTPGRAALLVVGASSIAVGLVIACSPSKGGDAGSEGCPALSTTCPNPATTWAEVEPVIIKYCFQCHGEGGIEESMFDYTTYAGEYKNRSEMLTQVYQCQMPPYDASPPTEAFPTAQDRQTIVAWLVCGAPGPDAAGD
jgi:hypothetical protein